MTQTHTTRKTVATFWREPDGTLEETAHIAALMKLMPALGEAQQRRRRHERPELEPCPALGELQQTVWRPDDPLRDAHGGRRGLLHVLTVDRLRRLRS
jgi:hypothetical protein